MNERPVAIVPHLAFEPEALVVPLDLIVHLTGDADTQQWALERLRKGDLGPAFVGGGEVWTEASDLEDARGELVCLLTARCMGGIR